MPPNRGMSLEDKRLTLMNIFHETQEVFLLKDVEKLGSKRGVVLQSIKEVLQSLVDDDLVHCERIGVSNFFWSFPSEAAVKLEAEAAKLNCRLQAGQSERALLEGQLAESRVGKEESEERRALVREADELAAAVEARQKELVQYSANDPERYEALKQATMVARDSANRWTDNVFALQSWMRKKFPGMESGLADFFRERSIGWVPIMQQGVTEDMDYVEAK